MNPDTSQLMEHADSIDLKFYLVPGRVNQWWYPEDYAQTRCPVL